MKKQMKINQKWNAPIYLFIFCFISITLLYGRLIKLTVFPVVNGINIDDFAKMRNTETRKLYANRGTIYDNSGNILALNVSSYTVIAYLDPKRTTNEIRPQHVIDKGKTAKELAPLLGMEESYLLELLSRKSYQVELGPGGRDITELKKDEIIKLNLPGLDFIENYKRYYPNGDFASYIIGYAKRYEDFEQVDDIKRTVFNIVGELGIESKYDEMLKGVDGSLTFQKDQHGYKIPDTKEDRINAVNGNNIYLTIDSSIQRFLEAETKAVSEKYEPEWIQISVMDAKTGKILGSASSPSYDPNIRDIVNYENPLTSHLFEPGSTMKTYTYMCAIENGKYKGSDTFKSGKIELSGKIISDWNNYGWGEITYDKGYEYSSNTGIANILGKFINKNELLDCFKKYGFGATTNVELSRELAGDLKFNYDIEVANAGFGQGITTTAIQHLQALSLISNDGKMLKPYIIDKIVDPNKNEVVYEGKRTEEERAVSTKTVNKIKELMYNVMHGTDDGSTGKAYYIEGFDILGKTGTSQIFDNKTKQYLYGTNNYIFSFEGLYPKDDPEVIIYAAMKKPNSGANYALSQATKSVMKNIAKYLNIFEGKRDNANNPKIKLQSYLSKNTIDINNELVKNNLKPIILGNGDKIISQYPKLNTNVLANDKVLLKTNDSNIKMPNLIGWSRSEVINLANLLGIEYEFEGYGYVVSQSIEKDIVVKPGDKLELSLERKFIIEQPKEESTNE